MSGDTIQILIAMVAYLGLVIGIGFYFYRRSSQSSEHYFIGGRSLGPWVTALSAEASDMSGWLLMGLPGLAYWCGLSDAVWTAIGLAVGTYLNWLLVSRRLRNYSVVAGNAITIPEFFSQRFREDKKVILTIAAVFILIFFAVYAASCFVTFGKLFSVLFSVDYQLVMIIGAAVVVLYTYAGGFLAESVSDFVQGIIMILALGVVTVVGVSAAGGLSVILENIKSIPGFFEFFGIAAPQTVDGMQQVGASGEPLFGPAGTYGFMAILSALAWGLGYFGMPQVLIRFMAIDDARNLKKSRRIAIVWCVISLVAAIFIGLVGRVLYPAELLTPSTAENIFIITSTGLLPPLLAGIFMTGILAATMSSSDSYLLIASSAFAKNLFQGIMKKEATDRQVMVMSRVALVAISIIGVIIALDESSVIFTVVSFAWAGFGATFGPIMLFSLFWKRTTRSGAIAGMLVGGGVVLIWKLLLKPMGGFFAIYELLPAFILSCIAILVVSLLSSPPEQQILDEFEAAKAG